MTEPITAEELKHSIGCMEKGDYDVRRGLMPTCIALDLLKHATSALRSIPPGEGLLVRLPAMEWWDENALLGSLTSMHHPKLVEAVRDAIERRDNEHADADTEPNP